MCQLHIFLEKIAYPLYSTVQNTVVSLFDLNRSKHSARILMLPNTVATTEKLPTIHSRVTTTLLEEVNSHFSRPFHTTVQLLEHDNIPHGTSTTVSFYFPPPLETTRLVCLGVNGQNINYI
jgi:hypothetical protein